MSSLTVRLGYSFFLSIRRHVSTHFVEHKKKQ
nr:MAG TPA: hypothetical protein [Crassvirales sp.]